MATVAFPLLVCVAGLFAYYVSDKAKQPGLVAFGVGLLVLVQQLANHQIHW